MTTKTSMEDLVKKVGIIERLMSEHIGSGGDVDDGLMPHRIANTHTSGFINPTMFRQLRSANGQYTWEEDGTDVFTLPEGRYRIAGSPNRPNDSNISENNIIMYDVYIKDNFKKIVATTAYNGEHYLYVEYDNKVVVNWALKPSYTLLFSGYQNSGQITITSDISLFRGVRFEYSVGDVFQSFDAEMKDKNRRFELIVPGQTHGENDTWLSSNQMVTHFSDSKTIVIDSNKRINYDGTGAVNTQAGSIAIGRIYGIV